MKKLLVWLILGLVLSACGRGLMDPLYTLALPDLPPAWLELLGTPQWRIEWISPGGIKEQAIRAGNAEAALPQTWANPVSAWPFWPARGVAPGIFRPAGAIFPFDAAGDTLFLSWQGGVDALLYWELDAAWAAGKASGASSIRRPQNFDWPRFRELLNDPSILEKTKADPWTVDWKAAAAKIVSSGFYRSYIRSEDRVETPIPVSSGPWIDTSPFAPPLLFGEGEEPVFPIGPSPKSWFSPTGILRGTTETWILIPWE
jgi:hypothetical protein